MSEVYHFFLFLNLSGEDKAKKTEENIDYHSDKKSCLIQKKTILQIFLFLVDQL